MGPSARFGPILVLAGCASAPAWTDSAAERLEAERPVHPHGDDPGHGVVPPGVRSLLGGALAYPGGVLEQTGPDADPLDACAWAYDTTGERGSVPDLAASGEGDVYLSFVDGGQVWLAVLGEGAEAVPDSFGADDRFRKPRVAWGAGAVHLVWGSSERDLEYARRDAGWLRERVATVDELFSVPQIAATPDGSAHVVAQWCRTRECPSSPIAAWHRGPSGGWDGPVLLSDESAEWRDAALVADGSGLVHAVWKGAFRPGQHRTRDAAGAWGALQLIEAATGDTVSFGDLAVGPGDLPHHAFFEFGSLAMAYARLEAGGAWSESEALAGPLAESGDYDMRPGVAVSGQGVVTVGWAQYDPAKGGPGPILVCQGAAGSWACGQLAADSGVAHGKVAVAYAEGTFHLVWRDVDGTLAWFRVACPFY